MPTSAVEIHVPNAESVTITDDALTVALSDGRTLSVLLAWFPRLLHATPEERDNWRFIGKGQGIHWEDVDEDISIENLLAGEPSGESQTSLKKWLQSRTLQWRSRCQEWYLLVDSHLLEAIGRTRLNVQGERDIAMAKQPAYEEALALATALPLDQLAQLVVALSELLQKRYAT